MPNVWIDSRAERELQAVIEKYKKEPGIVITRSQAISLLYWPMHKGDEKQ
jgi:hypothetical protein